MKRKILLILLLLIVLTLALGFATQGPEAVTHLKATPQYGYILLTWNPVSNVNGYLVYRKVGDENFKHRLTTENPYLHDTTSSSTEFNFYLVFSYRIVGGKKVISPPSKYVYAKAMPVTLLRVQNFKAVSSVNKVKLSWLPSSYTHGYAIFKKGPGDNNPTLLATTTNRYFSDYNAAVGAWSFYWVFPYKWEGSKRIFGPASNYAYGTSLPPPSPQN